MFVIALVPIVLGVLVGWGGFLGLREKLPRDRGAGVRTAATMRSDDAFRLGNKVAGLPTLAGGVIAVLAGAAALVMPTTSGLVLASVVGVLGLIALVAAGGVLGNRAAATVPEPEPARPAGCSGCACGTCGVFKKADTATA
ncbi:SdpI family protein [Amycolatopsis sp. cmx-11-51]|uniref:SdpI family protein n=1 Tax=unclassified Amycolatopsis TaxID=2618356 RepID=UPI0039E434B1